MRLNGGEWGPSSVICGYVNGDTVSGVMSVDICGDIEVEFLAKKIYDSTAGCMRRWAKTYSRLL